MKEKKNSKIRKFETGATRDTEEEKLDYEGFMSPIVLKVYEQFIEKERMRAWAAGLFEGEGCITFCKQKGYKRKDGTYTRPQGYKYPRLSMSLTDEDVIRKFNCIVGGTLSKKSKSLPSGKQLWYWSSQGKDAFNTIKIILPYLGLRRAMRLAEVFGIKKMAVVAGIEPIVFEVYGKYMHRHRLQTDGELRDSDNWQNMFGDKHYDVCMKSLTRHFIDLWLEHRGFKSRDGKKDALCGILFNTMAYLFKMEKEDM